MSEAGLFVALLVSGYLFGRLAEVRHQKSIVKRELGSQGLPVVASRYPPQDMAYDQVLVSGSVVIASDYFKSFMAGLINLFGGRVSPYESMLDRARREALLRMKAVAGEQQARYVFNVKYDTTRIAVGRVGAMEVLAYGTAMIPRPGVRSSDRPAG